jgi:hypothetical protein
MIIFTIASNVSNESYFRNRLTSGFYALAYEKICIFSGLYYGFCLVLQSVRPLSVQKTHLINVIDMFVLTIIRISFNRRENNDNGYEIELIKSDIISLI